MNNILLIAGSRSFKDWDQEYIFYYFDHLERAFGVDFDRIISGGAAGIDTIAREWATFIAMPFDEYPANWDQHGKAAGFMRNLDMGADCTHGLIIWDGQSQGTLNMIEILKDIRKPHIVVTLYGTE